MLRRYEYIAQKEHFCDICCNYILPGEMYEGIVKIVNNRLVVFKNHINPCCDFSPDPDDYDEKDKEDNKPEESDLELSLEDAAWNLEYKSLLR